MDGCFRDMISGPRPECFEKEVSDVIESSGTSN